MQCHSHPGGHRMISLESDWLPKIKAHLLLVIGWDTIRLLGKRKKCSVTCPLLIMGWYTMSGNAWRIKMQCHSPTGGHRTHGTWWETAGKINMKYHSHTVGYGPGMRHESAWQCMYGGHSPSVGRGIRCEKIPGKVKNAMSLTSWWSWSWEVRHVEKNGCHSHSVGHDICLVKENNAESLTFWLFWDEATGHETVLPEEEVMQYHSHTV